MAMQIDLQWSQHYKSNVKPRKYTKLDKKMFGTKPKPKLVRLGCKQNTLSSLQTINYFYGVYSIYIGKEISISTGRK